METDYDNTFVVCFFFFFFVFVVDDEDEDAVFLFFALMMQGKQTYVFSSFRQKMKTTLLGSAEEKTKCVARLGIESGTSGSWGPLALESIEPGTSGS